MSEINSISVEGLSVSLTEINVKGGTLEYIDDGKKGRRLSYIGLGAQNEPLEEIFDFSKYTVSTIQSADLPVLILTPHDNTKKEVHITLKNSDATKNFLRNIKTIKEKKSRRTESMKGNIHKPESERKTYRKTMHLDKWTKEEIGPDALLGINIGDTSIRNSDLSWPPPNSETAYPEPLRTDGETSSSNSSDSERRGSADGSEELMPADKSQDTKLDDDDDDPNVGDTRL